MVDVFNQKIFNTMGLKKFFAKLMGFEATPKELEGLTEKDMEDATSKLKEAEDNMEIDKALGEKPRISEDMTKAPNEIIEEPTQKPFTEKEMEGVLKPIDEAKEKADAEANRVPGDNDF